MTRILYVIDGLEFGGGERTFLQLIQHLPSAEYEIHVATHPSGLFADKLRKLEIPVHPLDLSKKNNLGKVGQLRSIIQKHRINIVHCQGARADFFSRMATKKLKKVRLVNTVAMPVEGFDVNPLLRCIYRIADRYTERFVDRFIVVSDRLRKTLTHKHHIPAEKIRLIYNGIELNEYDPNQFQEKSEEARREFGIPKDAFLVAAIGRLVWQKGFEYLVEAARHFTSDNIKVLIVGDGPLKSRLQQLAKDYGLEDRVTFTGHRQDIPAVLACANVVVIPSLLEGFPMVTLEAMTMGKPIVATRIDGVTEQIVDRNHGLLVPAEDPLALADAVSILERGPELADMLAKKARKRVESEFSLELMVRSTMKTYAELAER